MKKLGNMATRELIDFGFTNYGIELKDFGFSFRDDGSIKNRNKKQMAIARINDVIDCIDEIDNEEVKKSIKLHKMAKQKMVNEIEKITGNNHLFKKLMRLNKVELLKRLETHRELDKEWQEAQKIKTIIRVGEKNNFNMTNREHKELEKYTSKGKIFVNSNAFTTIKSVYPSIITINPYMEFVPLKGDLSNVKAVRLKVFLTSRIEYRIEMEKCIKFCCDNNLRILLTFMRYSSTKTAVKYSGKDFKGFGYSWAGNYFRPSQGLKSYLYAWVKTLIAFNNCKPFDLLYTCDYNGKGCPDCMNCTNLTYDTIDVEIKALNLSISGINDKYGKRGLCPYHCPDCFAKKVTFGKRPQCDKLITNKKITGQV